VVNSQDNKRGMRGVGGEFILRVGPDSRSFGTDHPTSAGLVARGKMHSQTSA